MSYPSATELFWKYQPRFRELQLKPLGFLSKRQPGRFHFVPGGNYSFFDYCDYPYVGLIERKFVYNCVIDSEKKETPLAQLQMAAWKEINNRIFGFRKFYLDPNSDDIDSVFNAYIQGISKVQIIRCNFTYIGDEISCLYLPQGRIRDWSAFIPIMSPEYAAIRALCALEIQKQYIAPENIGKSTELSRLERMYEEALAVVTD